MIIDILSSDTSVAGEMDFVAATPGPLLVPVNPPGGAHGLVFSGSLGAWFRDGESLILTGVVVNIPYGFGQATGTAFFVMCWLDQAGVEYDVPEFGGNNTLKLPNICGTLEFPPDGIFLVAPKGHGSLQLRLKDFDFNVSMLNLPAELDGETISAQIHLRVNHTIVMTAVP